MAQTFVVGSSLGAQPFSCGGGPVQLGRARATGLAPIRQASAFAAVLQGGALLGGSAVFLAGARRARRPLLGSAGAVAAGRGQRPAVGRGRAPTAAASVAGVQEASLRYPGLNGGEDLRRFAQDLSACMRSGETWAWAEAKALVQDATKLMAAEKSLERIQIIPGGHINVVGDVHGQFFDLFTIWEENGLPDVSNPYIFNGDFVDRGSYSVEILLALLAWKVACPGHMHLARGNHEAHSMNLPYGFTGEVLTKYGPEAYLDFQALFNNLPLAHVVNNHVLVVHGGLPRDAKVRLADIEALDRVEESSQQYPSELFTDLLWADPCPTKGHHRSQRGAGVFTFGPDVTHEFLQANGLGLLIRSHEMKDEGFEWTHNKQCLTVFSAPDYCDSCDNLGAVIRLKVPAGGGPPETDIRTFSVTARPDYYVPAMAYSPMHPGCKLSKSARQMIRNMQG